MDEVDLRSYDGGSQAQLTQNDRDKGGHEAHDLEASRNSYFFPFYPGYCFSPLMTERFRLELLMDQRPYVVAPLMGNKIHTVRARYHSWLTGKARC